MLALAVCPKIGVEDERTSVGVDVKIGGKMFQNIPKNMFDFERKKFKRPGGRPRHEFMRTFFFVSCCAFLTAYRQHTARYICKVAKAALEPSNQQLRGPLCGSRSPCMVRFLGLRGIQCPLSLGHGDGWGPSKWEADLLWLSSVSGLKGGRPWRRRRRKKKY